VNLADWRFEQAEWALLPCDIRFAEWLDTEQRLATARRIVAASAMTLLTKTGRTAA
jgi:hypothetical protein